MGEEISIEARLEPDEKLICLLASGPFMLSGSIDLTALNQLLDIIKSNNPHILILVNQFKI